MADGPHELHLTQHRTVAWMLYPAGAIACIILGAWVGSRFEPDASPDASADWTVPGLAIGTMCAALLAGWALTAWALRAGERRAARRVLAAATARWPQYSTTAQWQRVIEADAARGASRADILIPIVILSVIFGGLTVAAVFQSLWGLVGGLVGFWLVVVALVGGRHLNERRERRANRIRRERITPFPVCAIGIHGLYNDDYGLVRFDQLGGVNVVAPGDVGERRKQLARQSRDGTVVVELDPLDRRLSGSGWSLLELTFDSKIARTWADKLAELLRAGEGRHLHTVEVFFVRVPPDATPSAGDVAATLTPPGLASTR
jgi:hypothetical protein